MKNSMESLCLLTGLDFGVSIEQLCVCLYSLGYGFCYLWFALFVLRFFTPDDSALWSSCYIVISHQSMYYRLLPDLTSLCSFFLSFFIVHFICRLHLSSMFNSMPKVLHSFSNLLLIPMKKAIRPLKISAQPFIVI